MNQNETGFVSPARDKWKVYFSGSFWGHKKRERPGRELAIQKEFTWDGVRVQIPAVYLCGAGMVVDFCIAVEEKRIRTFIDKWYESAAGDKIRGLTEEERESMAREDPMSFSFRPRVRLNGRELLGCHSCGCTWSPYMPEGTAVNEDAVRVLEHYGCDRNYGWIFKRAAFSWNTARRPEIRKLCLRLESEPSSFFGPHFYMDEPNQAIELTHPITGQRHTVTVLSCSDEVLPDRLFPDPSYDYPSHFRQVTYCISPGLTGGELAIRDCGRGDHQVLKQTENAGTEGGSTSAVSGVSVIIGGADGPTAIFVAGRGKGKETNLAVSSLYFELPKRIEWRAVFREKTREDIEVAVFKAGEEGTGE